MPFALNFKRDWFLLGLGAAVALAFAVPGPGARGGALAPEITNKLGVALIFFLHGVGLSLEAMLDGTRRYRVHLLVQLTTFGLFPIVGFALSPLVAHWFGPGLSLGFFFLCALPSTVSSSVAMTALARGNVAAAVFNATLSSLLGVVLTPFWVGLYLSRTGIALPFGDVVLDLLRWLVLPLALGQVLRPLLKQFVERHRAAVSVVDRAAILLLVYTSFCDSVMGGVFTRNGVVSLFVVLCLDAALLSAALGLLTWLAGTLRFSHGDRSAAVFCGSKKTLAGGVPMAKVMFGNGPALGLILLPILIYHSIQLVIVAWLAARWAKTAETR